MKCPSWSKFKCDVSNFEKKIGDGIKEIKDNQPLLDNTIQSLISNLLLPPINGIVLDIYNSAPGENSQQKLGPVMGFLKNLEFQGEKHYQETIKKLDKIISGTECIQKMSMEQKQMMQNILINQGETQQTMIVQFENVISRLCRIESKMDALGIEQVIDPQKTIEIPKYILDELDRLTAENRDLMENPQNHIEFLEKQSSTYFYAKEIEKMHTIVQTLLMIDSNNVHALIGLGIYHKELREYTKAIKSYDKAIELNPKQADAHNNRGNSLNEMKQYDDALKSYNKAIELDPKYAGAYYNRGILLHEMKQYDDALKSYNKAIELDPKIKNIEFEKNFV